MKTLKQTLKEINENAFINYFRNGEFILDTSELKMNWRVKEVKWENTPWGWECNIYC